MAGTLPTETILDLASSLGVDADAIFEALYSLANIAAEEVVEAIESIRTTDVNTLRAYFAGECTLDSELDAWMEAA
jgi:hypothetical protein